MKKVLFGLLLVLLFSFQSFAIQLKGKVLDGKTKEPLIGANVIIRGTKIGAVTDVNGVFTIKADITGDFWLEIRYVGYKSIAQKYSSSQDLTDLVFYMTEDVFKAEEVVVTGIASKTSKAIAEVAVSSVSADKLTEEQSYQDVSQLVSGKIAGVYVKPTSGNVGGGFRFNVRASAGLNGNEQPVIYVDGVRVDNSQWSGAGVGGQGIGLLADLNPEDIEKIEVLKGAAGAASYGTGGSNGVILITTKRGKKGTKTGKGVKVDYKFVSGFNTQSFKYSTDDFYSADSANAIFRDGVIRQHSLGISGGSPTLHYYLSLDNRYEEGILNNNSMDRKSIRLNIDAFPSDKLVIRASSYYAKNKITRPFNDNNIFGYLGNTLLMKTPYGWTPHESIDAEEDVAYDNRFISSISAEYKLYSYLTFYGSIGLDESDMQNYQLFPVNYDYMLYDTGDKTVLHRHHTNTTVDLHFTFEKEVYKGLKNTTIVGTQLFDRRYRDYWFEKANFLTGLITNIGAGSEFKGGDEFYSNTRSAGIFAESNFDYNTTYFWTVMLRRDYASTIGEDAPNIFYPKFSFAARLDKFDFFPKMFSLMKVRVAYGETGTLPGATDGIPLLWTASNSGFGVGAALSRIGNSEIEPERKKELEVGFDCEFLNHYAFEFTYYKEKVVNSIVSFENAPSTGKTASAVPFNIGESKGWGIETKLDASYFRTENFELNFTLINNYATNEVVSLGGAQPIFDGFDLNVIKEGLRKHEFYTWKVLGAKFDEEGKYIGPEVTADREDVGSPIPSYTGSFRMDFKFFKNFRLAVLADWATGLKVFNNTKLFQIRFGNNPEYNELQEKLNTLTPGSAEYKAAAEKFARLDWRYDYNFIEDADFLKLREISFSYSLNDMVKKLKFDKYISDLSLVLTGRNLLTITGYSGADPEVNFDGARSLSRGQDFLTLQNPRTYTLMFRISF